MTNRKGARPPVVLLALYGLLGHILSVPDVGYAQGAIDQGYQILEGARLSGWLSDYVQEYSADPIMQPVEDVEAITVDTSFRPVYEFSGPFLSGVPIVAPSNAVGGAYEDLVLGTLLYHHAPIGVGFFAIPPGGSTPQSLNQLWDLEQSKILWSTMQADDLVVYLPQLNEVYLVRGGDAVALSPGSRDALGELPVPLSAIQSYLMNWSATAAPPTQMWSQLLTEHPPFPGSPTPSAQATPTPSTNSWAGPQTSRIAAASVAFLIALLVGLSYARRTQSAIR